MAKQPDTWRRDLPEPYLDTPRSIYAAGPMAAVRLQKEVDGLAQQVTYTTTLWIKGKRDPPRRVVNMPLDAAVRHFIHLYWNHVAPEPPPVPV